MYGGFGLAKSGDRRATRWPHKSKTVMLDDVDDGTAVVHYRFSTGANYKRPEPHAHLLFAWVVVAAHRYGTVVVPVRHDSMPTAKLREQKELFVPIGLVPAE